MDRGNIADNTLTLKDLLLKAMIREKVETVSLNKI